MRRITPPGHPGGIIFFFAIGAGAAVSFIALSTFAVSLAPAEDAWVVNALCYAAFVLPVYLLHRRYTFRSETSHAFALPRYIAVQAMAVLLATLFGYVFYSTFGLPSLPAAILVAGLTAGVNYLVLKLWVFATALRSAVS